MDTSSFVDKYSPVIRQYWLPILLGGIGLMFFVYGLIGSLAGQQAASGTSKDKPDILFEAASDVSEGRKKEESGVNLKQIIVDVEGAVEKPGVYKVNQGDRIQDALIAAGGMSKEANREFVAKGINLASKLIDGDKLYVPFEGEEYPVVNGSQVVLGMGVNSPIDINKATESELDTLPGIGPVISRKIMENRPYGSIEELVKKKIVGSKVFEEIKEKIGVN